MHFRKMVILSVTAALSFSSASFAQSSLDPSCQVEPGKFERVCFCEDKQNETRYGDQYDEACLGLLPGGAQITNFAQAIPFVVLGAGGIALIADESTTSSTSTTN